MGGCGWDEYVTQTETFWPTWMENQGSATDLRRWRRMTHDPQTFIREAVPLLRAHWALVFHTDAFPTLPHKRSHSARPHVWGTAPEAVGGQPAWGRLVLTLCQARKENFAREITLQEVHRSSASKHRLLRCCLLVLLASLAAVPRVTHSGIDAWEQSTVKSSLQWPLLLLLPCKYIYIYFFFLFREKK